MINDIMMKKKLCIVLMLFSGIFVSNAQIAQWVLRPVYDTMYVPVNTPLIVVDSLGSYTRVLDFEGNLLSQFEDKVIHDFREGIAVVTERGSSNLSGFLEKGGRFSEITKTTLQVDKSWPFFSDGRLLVKTPNKGYYRYMDKNGKCSNYYPKAFPFFNGYAKCEQFENMEREKGRIQCLVTPNMTPVDFTYNGKRIKVTDLDFVSSVNDDGIAIVVADRRVFLYDADSALMKPLCSRKDIHNKRDQAKLYDKEINQCLSENKKAKEWALRVESGNTSFSIIFDEFMKLKAICYPDDPKPESFGVSVEERTEPKTTLSVIREGRVLGLKRDDKEVLAPQFENVYACFGDKAIVKKNGKCGLLKVVPRGKFVVSIDGNDRIPFAHKEKEANIRVEFPSFIPSEKVSIKTDDSSNIRIDKYSKEGKNTHEGNYVQYSCLLNIPEILFEEEAAKESYTLQIVYDEFTSPEIAVEKEVKLCRNWDVKVDERSRQLKGDSLIFDCSLEYSDLQERNPKYNVKVIAQPESLCRKFSFNDTRFRCIVKVHEGINEISLYLEEEDFPASSFPVLFEYRPKIEASKENPKEKEAEVVSFEVKEVKSVKTVRDKRRVKKDDSKSNKKDLKEKLDMNLF